MRVFVLNAGGTLGMVGKPLRPAKSAAELFADISPPKNVDVGLFDFPTREDSTNISYAECALMCVMINGMYQDYDAFIILHGTDTLAETCAFISLAFGQSLQKPVFVIGAHVPKDQPGSDAKRQISHALRAAKAFVSKGVVGVYSVCDGNILDGTRMFKRKASKKGLTTPGRRAVGFVRRSAVDIIGGRRRDPTFVATGLTPDTRYEPYVSPPIEVSANSPPSVLLAMTARTNLHGVILVGKGEGNYPDKKWFFGEDLGYSWLTAIQEVAGAGVYVGTMAPFPDGKMNPDKYELGYKAHQAGAIPLIGLTPPMADVKFRMAIARFGDDRASIERFIATNVVGELLEGTPGPKPH